MLLACALLLVAAPGGLSPRLARLGTGLELQHLVTDSLGHARFTLWFGGNERGHGWGTGSGVGHEMTSPTERLPTLEADRARNQFLRIRQLEGRRNAPGGR